MIPEVRKQVMRRLTYGLYVMTASFDGDMAAGTITWISQASFSPPLVMVGVKAESRLHEIVERSGSFAVNMLGSSQKDVASAFFRPSQITPGHLNGYAYESGPQTGSPLLIDLPAWFEARVTDTIKRGDHTVFVAEVVHAGVRGGDLMPLRLADTNWSYGG